MQKIITLRDVTKAKRAADAISAAIDADKAIKRAQQLLALAENIHIGELVRNGKSVFYTYIDGQYVESNNVYDLI